MPAFWMEATVYTVDEEYFNKFTKRWQNQVMRGAVRKFLKGVLSRIPKRTGFLRGAFSDLRQTFAKDTGGGGGDASGDGPNALLGSIFGGAKTPRVESGKDDALSREKRIQELMKQHAKHAKKGPRNARDKLREFYTASAGGKGSKVLKTPRSGVQFATPADEALTFNGNVATFFFDVTISYYRINDFFSRIKGAPWQSMMEGGSEMANWIGRCADLFPNITEILAKQKIVQRGSRIKQTKLPQETVAQRLLTIRGLTPDTGPLPSGPPPNFTPPSSGKRELQKAILLAQKLHKRKKA